MRLDVFLVKKSYYKSRTKAVEALVRGEVFVDGKACFKSSKDVDDSNEIKIVEKTRPFVSLGGFKLECAINKINAEIKDKTFIDVGASTGGFTDCLLRHGAKKVYCVDVGENLLDEDISKDERVVVMDKTNARFLKPVDFDEKSDGIVVDCSFISLEYILPPLKDLIKDDGYILALIKPQFELNERTKMKNGVLRDDKKRFEILKKIYEFSISLGFCPTAIVNVTQDKKKNTEYIFYLKNKGEAVNFENIIC